jgi:hypothetical protein
MPVLQKEYHIDLGSGKKEVIRLPDARAAGVSPAHAEPGSECYACLD